MWRFLGGAIVGAYVGTYWNLRPYFEMAKQHLYEARRQLLEVRDQGKK